MGLARCVCAVHFLASGLAVFFRQHVRYRPAGADEIRQAASNRHHHATQVLILQPIQPKCSATELRIVEQYRGKS